MTCGADDAKEAQTTSRWYRWSTGGSDVQHVEQMVLIWHSGGKDGAQVAQMSLRWHRCRAYEADGAHFSLRSCSDAGNEEQPKNALRWHSTELLSEVIEKSHFDAREEIARGA